jgi:DnaK suppressor protein
MTTTQRQEYRKALSDLGRRLKKGLAHDQREVMRMELPDLPSGPMPSTDEVLDSGTQEIEVGLIANEQALLEEVTAALARIDAGTFGRCETCGTGITKSRLHAVPYARRCIKCERVAESQPAAGAR